MAIGEIIQVIGPTVDIKFPPDELPPILNAIRIEDAKSGINLIVEAAQHIGNDIVRCIGMGSTDGLVRGMKAADEGGPISVPVGEQALGRIFNVLGDPIDGKGSIHQPSPKFEEQVPVASILETGIKVVDLLAPYAKGGKVGLFGGAGVGKTVI